MQMIIIRGLLRTQAPRSLIHGGQRILKLKGSIQLFLQRRTATPTLT